MRDMNDPLVLSSLSGDFEIVGELGRNGSARTFLATKKDAAGKRKDDQTGVLIEVVTAPEGDEGKSLSHLAADTQSLVRLRHRRLVPVLEGRWIGTDAFAVVTPRIGDPSLAQMLDQGEPFTNTRTAAILREVNGLLEWAREQKVVHRNVTPDRIYLEPKTDRVRLSFAVAAIPRIQTADPAEADARTIGRLAMAMLTGHVDPEAHEGESLGELRPDLPEQLVEATAALVDGTSSNTDVSAFIALVGMAEPLFAGETEAERIRAEVLEEQRMEREKLAGERDAFERTMEEERQKLAMERQKLYAAIAEERGALVARRAELEREVADRRSELERAAQEDREQLADLRVAIERASELEIEKKRLAVLDEIADEESALGRGELATPQLMLPASTPLQPLTFEPLAFAATAETPGHATGGAAGNAAGGARRGSPRYRKWILPGALGAAAIAVVAILVVAGRPTSAPLAAKPAANPVTSASVPAATIAPSSTPAVPSPTVPSPATPSPTVPLPPAVHMDSSTVARAPRHDSTRVVAPVVKRKPKPVVPDTVVPRETTAIRDILSRVPGASPVRPDTIVRRDTGARPDSTGVPPGNPPFNLQR
jgi:hypothetical protein